MLATATLGAAFTHVTEYSTNLDNYRGLRGRRAPRHVCVRGRAITERLPPHQTAPRDLGLHRDPSPRFGIDAIELDTNHPRIPSATQSYHCVRPAAERVRRSAKGRGVRVPILHAARPTRNVGRSPATAVRRTTVAVWRRRRRRCPNAAKVDDSRHWAPCSAATTPSTSVRSASPARSCCEATMTAGAWSSVISRSSPPVPPPAAASTTAACRARRPARAGTRPRSTTSRSATRRQRRRHPEVGEREDHRGLSVAERRPGQDR